MPASNRVHLILGYACNHHCRYCTQEINGRPTGVKKHISPKVVELLNKKAISLFPNRLRICFFGGEPLLYSHAIKEILAEVNQPNICWKIHSNGDLLTQDIVDLFNRHDVSFGLSHDGPNVLKTRGIDVLKDKNRIFLYNQLKRKFIEVVITSYSQNLYEIHDYFQNILGNDNWRFKPAFLINPSSVPLDMLNYDYEKWEITVEQICQKAKEQILEGVTLDSSSWEAGLIGQTICDAILPVKENPFMRFSERCSVPHIDLNGNLSFCELYEARHKKGNVESSIEFFNFTKSNHPNCPNCLVFPYCHGQCPVEKMSHTPQHCRFLRTFYRHAFEVHDYLYRNAPQALREALLVHLPHEFRAKNNLG